MLAMYRDPLGSNWQILAGLQGSGVDRGSTVADEQGAGVPVGDRLRRRLGQARRALRPDTDVAVRIDQAGQDVTAVADSGGLRHRVGADDPVGYPQLARFPGGQHDPS